MIKRINCGSGHRYTIDGKSATGVTTALKVIDKPALMTWAAKQVAQRVVDMSGAQWTELMAQGAHAAFWDLARTPDRERNKAAVRGTHVHNFAEKIMRGEEVAVPEHLYGHVESCVAFMDEWRVQPVLVETVVGDYSYGYAGTLDLVADLPDGRRVLFDYKTSASGIWPETALQLSAYRWASHFIPASQDVELPMTEIGITDCMAVHVRSDGYTVHPLRADTQVFGAFLNALHLHRAMQTAKTWVGGAVTPDATPAAWEVAA